MGMSIEDVREELISILTEIEITGGSMVTSIYKDELKMAIATMSKYQKIEQIIKFPVYIHEDVLRYKMICEVVEDGND